MEKRTPKARGAAENLPNRFERLHLEPDPDVQHTDEAGHAVPAVYLRDESRSILSSVEADDLPFDYSVNPYRGCEHGCIYCYARPNHEYLGFSLGLDFETRIIVKQGAPELLDKQLSSRRYKPGLINFSGNTDPYQPAEKKLLLTRRCLEVCLAHRQPVCIITKSPLILRDLDLLTAMAKRNLAAVAVSVTTLDLKLSLLMEPRGGAPNRRLAVLTRLREAGIPAGVSVSPVIPGLTDTEIPAILEACANAGCTHASYIVLRLPHNLKELFSAWLQRHMPERAGKVLSLIREVREGKLNESGYGKRFKGSGEYAGFISRLFTIACRQYGMQRGMPELDFSRFTHSPARQPGLFD